jgi:hypothetical protein
MIALVMAIDPSTFDDCHGSKILFFACIIRQPGIPACHLNAAVAQKLLNTLQSHAGIQKLTGKCMS